MELHTKTCVKTGCSILIHDATTTALVHGDLFLEVNNFTGGHFLYLSGIGRAKDGKMHCNVYESDSDVIPNAHLQVHGGIVGMQISDTGYGQVTFAQGTVEFSPELLQQMKMWIPESVDRVIQQYGMEIPRLTN